MQQIFNDVACTVCGCVCDDLQLTVDGSELVEVRRACRLAEPWFATLRAASTRPTATISGQPAAFDEAVARAVEILHAATKPLIYGLSRSSTAGQRAAIALAEQLGATIDTPGSSNPAATLALHTIGTSTCSLGEVRNRADLVIFWRADPLITHPRHLERYSAAPCSEFLPNGRADRKLIVVDSQPTETAAAADEFLAIESGNALVFIETLKKLVSGEELGTPDNSGLSLAQIEQLAAQMKSCRYGALFFDVGQGTNDESRVVEALLSLVRDLNKSTRFTAHYLPSSSGLTGAETVLCWQTGFPFAVNFASGFPRFHREDYSANQLLERGEVDACVVVGSETVGKLSAAAQHALHSVNTITLDYPNVESALAGTVQFTAAVYGIHTPGTAYRMDGVPIPLRKYIDTTYPTDETVLNTLAARLK
ncbi:MAG: formylmethanofuran dehydrogenase subunit B [Pirellulales bacterium]